MRHLCAQWICGAAYHIPSSVNSIGEKRQCLEHPCLRVPGGKQSAMWSSGTVRPAGQGLIPLEDLCEPDLKIRRQVPFHGTVCLPRVTISMSEIYCR